MKNVVTLAGAVAVVALPVMVWGASCPQELADAKTALKNAQAAMKKSTQTAAKGQDIQAPRSMAGAKSQDVQAPRGQDVQSPRGQDVQAPRGQDVQAPRGQDVQSPRGQDVQSPRGQDVQSPRGQDVQAPRGQNVQAPRGQDVQSPRGQDVQSPRGQDVQAPRGQDVQAPRTPAGARAVDAQAQKVKQASALIRESESACKKGDMALSTTKATEAQALLK